MQKISAVIQVQVCNPRSEKKKSGGRTGSYSSEGENCTTICASFGLIYTKNLLKVFRQFTTSDNLLLILSHSILNFESLLGLQYLPWVAI